MNRFGWISMLAGFVFGLLLWTAPPVWADCNPNIRATTPTSDFSLNDNNGTAIHLKTGLIWMRCVLGQSWNSTLKTCTGSPSYYTWGEALRAARGVSFAGYSDWRLPNAKELLSIVEERCWYPSINETVFPGVSSYWYWWSSSPDADDPNGAWYVPFYDGHVGAGNKSVRGHARLVRGGQWFGDYVGGGGSGAPVTLDVLDGQDFRTGTGLSTDPSVLGNLSKNRWMVGAATDGEARLVLRARANHPGAVTFSIPAGDGQLIHYQGTSSGSSVTVPTVPVGNEHMAFAIYRAPEQFPRAGHTEDESLARRWSTLTVTVTPSDGTPPKQESYSLALERPPVVLVHGWNSNKKDCWEQFDELLRASGRIPGISITKADYAKTSNEAFSVNASVPLYWVSKARKEFLQNRIAVVQADVIGHSMGGILSRIWAGNPQYRRNTNYGAGDFNKLITMDSPHRGSPIADYLYSVEVLTDTYLRCAGGYGLCIPEPPPENAIRDLCTNSTALATMRSREAKVPSHAIVGDYSQALSVDFSTVVDPWAKFIGEMLFDSFLPTQVSVLIPTNSDAVVGVNSQKGDLPGACSESAPAQCSDYDCVHWTIHNAPEVADRVVELLNAPATDGDLFEQNGFPWSSSASSSLSARRTAAANAATIIQGGIQIVAPPVGTVVQPGQAVTVTVQPNTGVTLEAVSLVTYQTWLHLDQAPFQFSLTVPTGAAGTLGMLVSAKDTAGVIHMAHTYLQVVPSVALSRLDVTPATVTFEQAGVQAGLQVDGIYADSSVRDLTAAATDATYQSSNTGVVTVDANGRLTAKSNGVATVTVANSGVSAYVTVQVEAESDLAISQTTSPNPIGADGLVTYTLTVQNQGTQRALNVQVSDTLPTGATLMQATGAGWVCNGSGGVVSCIRDALNAGATAPITLKVKAALPCDAITNQATVTASTPDSNANNNVSVATASCPRIYRITVTKRGVGIVTSQPPGIDCGATCSASFLRSAVVTLTASAFRGWQFARWTGCTLASGATCTVLRSTTNRTITATFNPVLTVFKFGEGTVTSDPAGINCGADCSEAYPLRGIVTLTAHAARGWTFQRWGGNCAGAAPTCAVSMTAARYVTTTFVRSRPGIFVD